MMSTLFQIHFFSYLCKDCSLKNKTKQKVFLVYFSGANILEHLK